MKQKYYFVIAERINPQLPNPYYIQCGRMTETYLDSLKCDNRGIYGTMTYISYDTVNDYTFAINELIDKGYRIIDDYPTG